MRILFFTPRQGWPADTGAKLRDFHLARELAKHGEVTYLGFRDALSGEDMTAVAHVFERVILLPRPGRYAPMTLVRGLVGPLPANVLLYANDDMRSTLARLLSEQAFDVVHVAGVHLAPYLPLISSAAGDAAVWFDWHNIESELMQRYSQSARNPFVRVYAWRTAAMLRRMEEELLASAHAVSIPSEREQQTLTAWPERRASIHVIANGVDCAGLAGAGSGLDAPQRKSIVFVGSMDYHANIDGVLWFANEIWPAISAARPDLTFRIVGRRPGKEVQALADRPSIEVTGQVEDVRPYYAEALAAVVPLRVGGGTRLKILEAMAAGVPVVSTRLGAEGLDVTDGQDLLLAETASEFVGALRRLSDVPSWRAIAEAARRTALDRYDWSAIGAALFAAQRAQAGQRITG